MSKEKKFDVGDKVFVGDKERLAGEVYSHNRGCYILNTEIGVLTAPLDIIFAKKSEDTVADDGVPKSWEDLGIFDGYYVNSECITEYHIDCPRDETKDIFATKDQAEASLALSMLSQLYKRYREDDYTLADSYHRLYLSGYARDVEICCIEYAFALEGAGFPFLSFYSKDLAKKFLEDHKELLEKAKPLL